MRREERPAAIDHCFPVSLKGVSKIVQRNVKQETQESIGQSIQVELGPRIIDNAASANEAGPEDCVPTFIQDSKVADKVTTVVRFVGHHHYDRITLHVIKPEGDGVSKSVRAQILDGTQGLHISPGPLQDFPSRVGASVVNHDDFMGNVLQP